jgi:ornithine decarboxylase
MDLISRGQEDSFYIIDLENVRERVQLWKKHLPQVKIHYAIKTNPNEMIIRELVRLGQSFDCASAWEMDRALNFGATPDQIIFAHPCKQR